MRWDELRIDDEERRTLPGYREPAAVRTFDAPEALDTRFYEVRAKSVLNRVPERSQMPFRWTVNPYRGCTHACSYCASGETPVLMGDGRTKPLADVRVGDYVYGTVRRGRYRPYAISQVRDHWSSIKPAYRITLEDGTELVASGDHRFLTVRGWRHVVGTEQGRDRRPHLTPGDRLHGAGRFAVQPDGCPDYRRGYLCGLIRGDGRRGASECWRGPARGPHVDRFRLPLTDLEALRRAKGFFQEESGVLAQTFGSRTETLDNLLSTQEMTHRPRTPRPEWCKGFLAGIYDGAGNNGDSLRISSADREIVEWICVSLRRLGFFYVVEDRQRPNALRSVRLLGGVREHMRFFLTVDPAITRKRSIEGVGLESTARLEVSAIEPLRGSYRLYDITTDTGDFVANGVVSHNCFARPTHTYLGFDAGRDFEREIVVKVNAPEVLRAELRRPSWGREHVAMGTNTDPYQWVEGRYRLMPGIWEALRDSGTPGSILTKSPLLLRDLELMRQVPGISANLSVPTLDEKAWRATEPHTPHPRKRLEAVAELNRAGIPSGILIAPLMPGINDDPKQVEPILELAAEAGAVSVGGIALHLRGEVREIFFYWLREHRPDLLDRYRSLYARGAYVPRNERERLAKLARGGANPGRRLISEPSPPVDATDPPRPAPEQPSLF